MEICRLEICQYRGRIILEIAQVVEDKYCEESLRRIIAMNRCEELLQSHAGRWVVDVEVVTSVGCQLFCKGQHLARSAASSSIRASRFSRGEYPRNLLAAEMSK